jgi:Cys-rich protein (TIGR01571 family)
MNYPPANNNSGPPVNPTVATQPGNPPNNVQRIWSTGIFDCLKDEETCWWSFWCCWLVSSRTTEEFSVGSAKTQVIWCLSIFFASFLLFVIGLPPIGILLLVGCAIYYVIYRGDNRKKIKEKLHIVQGNSFTDFLLHCWCTCCSVAQEARESKMNNNSPLDYCSSQELRELAPTQENLFLDEENIETIVLNPVINNQQPGSAASTAPATHQQQQPVVGLTQGLLHQNYRERFQSIYFKLSQTSQTILIALAIFSFIVVIALLIHNPLAVVVLILIFLQPIVLLYFVYWRNRRKFAQLDYVIKMFFVGFFLSTTQAVIFETLLQYIIGFIAIILYVLIHGVPPGAPNDENNNSTDAESGSFFLRTIGTTSDIHRQFSQLFENILPWRSITVLYRDSYETILSQENHCRFDSLLRNSKTVAESLFSAVSSSSDGSVQSVFLSLPPSPQHYDEFSSSSPSLLASPSFQPTSLQTSVTDNEEFLRDNVLLILFVLFLMAFVVAAGVEETMKHFVVRCCRFPTALKDPNVVLVYLVAAGEFFSLSFFFVFLN